MIEIEQQTQVVALKAKDAELQQLLQSYNPEPVVSELSEWQKERQQQAEPSNQQPVIVFPSDEVLAQKVHESLLKHLTGKQETLDPGDGLKLSDSRFSDEEIEARVSIVCSQIKNQFGLAEAEVIERKGDAVLYRPSEIPSLDFEYRFSTFRPDGDQNILGRLCQQGRQILDDGLNSELVSPVLIPDILPEYAKTTSSLPEIDTVKDLKLIGEGGMGAVYLCRIVEPDIPNDPGSPAVVKVIKSDIGSHDGVKERFEREAELLKELSQNLDPDSGIPRYLGSGVSSNGVSYLVQEYLPGFDLQHELPALHMFHEQVRANWGVALFPEMLRTLDKVHAADIVHRDLKPSNMMLIRNPQTCRPEKLVLLDFGLARKGSDPTSEQDTMPVGINGSLTPADCALGTPGFMSPEQAQGKTATAKSDVFAMGIILYELATGSHPFVPHDQNYLSPLQHMYAVSDANFERIHRQKVRDDPHMRLDPEFRELISDALSKDPDKRPTAGEFASRLEHYLAAPPRPEGLFSRLRDAFYSVTDRFF